MILKKYAAVPAGVCDCKKIKNNFAARGYSRSISTTGGRMFRKIFCGEKNGADCVTHGSLRLVLQCMPQGELHLNITSLQASAARI